MDLLSIIGILLRRWFVVVPVLVLTVLAAWHVHSRVPPQYEASGWVLLETPNLDATDDAMPELDIVAMGDDLAADPDGLPTGTRFVVQAGETPGRYVVSVAADSADAAETTATRVVDHISDRVRQIQEEAAVEEESRLHVRLVTPSIVPTPEADGSFSAQAAMEVRNPAMAIENPYGANAGTGRILEVAANGDSGMQNFLRRVDGNVGYAVSQASRDSAALLQVATFGSDRESVLGAFEVVRDILDEDLGARQERAGVPESQRITVETFDPPLRVEDVGPPVDRATAAVLLLGGLAALGLGIAADSLLGRRRSADVSTPPPSTKDVGERTDLVDGHGNGTTRGGGSAASTTSDPWTIASVASSSTGVEGHG